MPCKKSVAQEGTTCYLHPGFPRIPEGTRGPLYIAGYHDHLLLKKPSKNVLPDPRPWGDQGLSRRFSTNAPRALPDCSIPRLVQRLRTF